MFDKFPYTNFHELNLDYFINKFNEIFTEWEQLNSTMLAWKAATDASNALWKTSVENGLAAWKTATEADLNTREAALRAELAAWKTTTETDIGTWEADTLAALNAWKATAEATFEAIRVQAAASATAAQTAQTAAETAQTAAETAQTAAETAAASVSASAAQIATNAGDISDLKAQFEDNDELWGKVFDEYDNVSNVLDIAEITDNKYMNPANGNITDNTSYEIAEISLDNVDKVFIAYSRLDILGFAPISFFDENDNFISGYQPIVSSVDDMTTYNGHTGIYYTIPTNAKSAILSIAKSRIAIMYLVTIQENKDLLEVTIPLYKKKDNPFYGKTIVNFGDSIFGNFRDTNETTDKSISKMIEEATGATVYNAGFGGCRMAAHSSPWNAFSMYSLANSIASGDWTVQENALTSSLPDYFAETVAMLETLDFASIDYITIGYGTNDYSGNVFIKASDASFTYEWQYFEGALKYSIRTILNAYPNLKIIVISPCWRWFDDTDGAFSYDSDDAQSENTRHYKLPDYVDACKKVCEEYHIPYIDTYYTLGFNPYSYKAYFPVKGYDGYIVSDGTHPKQNGRQLRADRIVGQMESLY